jgi:hypothetical protein
MNLRRATATWVKDSKQTERIEGAQSLVIPFTLEEKWLFARGGQECMRWTSAKLYVLEHDRTPVQCGQKVSWTRQENWKEDHAEEGFEETQVAYRAVMGVEIWIERVGNLISGSRNESVEDVRDSSAHE